MSWISATRKQRFRFELRATLLQRSTFQNLQAHLGAITKEVYGPMTDPCVMQPTTSPPFLAHAPRLVSIHILLFFA